ncbi:MAG: hypothetical protein ABSH50_27390 [Bryobacteraceae bacterium]
MKQVGGKYETFGTVTTERGARTMTVDSKNHRVYVFAAEYGPRRKHPRTSARAHRSCRTFFAFW